MLYSIWSTTCSRMHLFCRGVLQIYLDLCIMWCQNTKLFIKLQILHQHIQLSGAFDYIVCVMIRETVFSQKWNRLRRWQHHHHIFQKILATTAGLVTPLSFWIKIQNVQEIIHFFISFYHEVVTIKLLFHCNSRDFTFFLSAFFLPQESVSKLSRR